MPLLRPRLLAASACIAATAFLLTSCSSPSDVSTSRDTLTVDTDFGEVTVPVEPKAALGFYTTDVDMLITLGFPLAKEQPLRDDWSAFPSFFPQDELAGIKGFHNFPEFNLEKVLDVEPDFILNGLGYETDLHDKLTPIAPTYTYNGFDGGDWRDKFDKIASDLGRAKQAEAWRDQYDARVAEVKAQLDENGVAPVVADVTFWGGQVQISCYSISCLVFKDLGLQISPLADGDGDGEPDSTGRALSPEQVGDLRDIDLIVTTVNQDGSDLITNNEAVTSNPLWASLPFVMNERIYPYNLEMAYGSPSGQDALLEVIGQALLK